MSNGSVIKKAEFVGFFRANSAGQRKKFSLKDDLIVRVYYQQHYAFVAVSGERYVQEFGCGQTLEEAVEALAFKVAVTHQPASNFQMFPLGHKLFLEHRRMFLRVEWESRRVTVSRMAKEEYELRLKLHGGDVSKVLSPEDLYVLLYNAQEGFQASEVELTPWPEARVEFGSLGGQALEVLNDITNYNRRNSAY